MDTLRTVNLKKYENELQKNDKLKGINLSVKKNEFVSIVYKTDFERNELINILSGFDNEIQGILYIDREDICLMDEKKLIDFRKKKIGFIFKDCNIVPSISVYENIILQLKLNNLKIDNEFIYDIVEIFGLVPKIHTSINNLEIYDKFIVALAGVIVMNPSIIFVDDILKNLNKFSRYEILRVFNIASKCFNKSIVMMSNTEGKIDFVDRIINIEERELNTKKIEK
jgi:putative ABC transport system ATP-binding protein